MTSNKMNGSLRKSLFAFGYIRRCESLESFKIASIKIPKAIIEVIALFYPNEFQFQSEHPLFTVTENGMSVSNHGDYGTILFGPFIHQNEKIKITVTFTKGYSGFNGFGFAADKFTEFATNDFNFDQDNHSRIIWYAQGEAGNSWSGSKWKSSCFSEIESFDPKESEEPNAVDGDTVCVEMNMITKVGKVYNKSYPDKPAALIDLHSNDGIAIAISMGSKGSPAITVIDQQFEYQLQ